MEVIEREKERLKFCIERFDHYYDSVNNKANVFLALATFILAGTISSYPFIQEKVNCGYWINGILLLNLSLGFGSLFTVLWSAVPYLGSAGKSLFFFGSIALMPYDTFSKLSASSNSESELEDLRVQVYHLAQGLKRKFNALRIAGTFFLLQLVLIIPLTICLFKNQI